MNIIDFAVHFTKRDIASEVSANTCSERFVGFRVVKWLTRSGYNTDGFQGKKEFDGSDRLIEFACNGLSISLHSSGVVRIKVTCGLC